ncbi:MAG: radical SAM protein [Dehalococcoidales bacterium]|nr:radical SAM protein [Dehalococcoidales bacterium]
MNMYDMVVIRPPSEADSLLLPVTIGCSHNTCTFCDAYMGIKFRIRHTADVIKDIQQIARNYSWSVRRVFLENGDALIAPQAMLLEILKELNRSFPRLERSGTYASPRSVLLKSAAELKELRELGLKIAYLGVETGDDTLLEKVKKGATSAEIIEAGRKLKEAGITVSAMVILGLAGVEKSMQHAVATGKILTKIDPEFAATLVLTLVPGTPLYQEWQEVKFSPISPLQTLVELNTIIENSAFTDCFFTANHASNYLPIKVHLPRQKEAVLKLLDDVINRKDVSRLKPEYLRAL